MTRIAPVRSIWLPDTGLTVMGRMVSIPVIQEWVLITLMDVTLKMATKAADFPDRHSENPQALVIIQV